VAKITVEDKGKFILFRWEGLLTESEVLAVAVEYYPRLGGRGKLYDMTLADLSGLTPQNLAAVAKTVSNVQPVGVFSRTAFVAGNANSYSILSRYLLAVFSNRVPVEYRVFMNLLRAEEWLNAS
jgi:hypothetical protein